MLPSDLLVGVLGVYIISVGKNYSSLSEKMLIEVYSVMCVKNDFCR